ncbi:MAG: hypothetical protein AVDCRST_MAG66-4242, partial [uncultured Pseudonocardia sp.]
DRGARHDDRQPARTAAADAGRAQRRRQGALSRVSLARPPPAPLPLHSAHPRRGGRPAAVV